MSYQPKNMSGTLFRNDKGDNAKRPDYRGDVCINDVIYEIAGWIKTGNNGKFMSLSVSPKEAQQQAPARQAAPSTSDDLSDIPF